MEGIKRKITKFYVGHPYISVFEVIFIFLLLQILSFPIPILYFKFESCFSHSSNVWFDVRVWQQLRKSQNDSITKMTEDLLRSHCLLETWVDWKLTKDQAGKLSTMLAEHKQCFTQSTHAGWGAGCQRSRQKTDSCRQNTSKGKANPKTSKAKAPPNIEEQRLEKQQQHGY